MVKPIMYEPLFRVHDGFLEVPYYQSASGGSRGFVSSVSVQSPGALTANGFDSSGKGPGADIDMCTVTFGATGTGSSVIGVNVVSLLDPDGRSIGTKKKEGGSITVNEETSDPFTEECVTIRAGYTPFSVFFFRSIFWSDSGPAALKNSVYSRCVFNYYYRMRSILKMAARVLSLLPPIAAAAFIVSNAYLLKQAAYILGYSLGARSIESILAQNIPDKKEKAFLLEVRDIKSFAVKKLGLADNGNYTTYLSLKKGYLVDVVSACRKDSFVQYFWTYPIFGKFPYKGFFERADAEEEARSLAKKNDDVIIRKVDAFSTLGFGKDPVYDFMSRYSVFDLASTIIHEQTHATIFLANEVQFNEELAVFVGREGALLYIAEKYGAGSKEYGEAEQSIRDDTAFVASIRELYRTLDELYSMNVPERVKLEARGIIMYAARERMRLDAIRRASGKGAGGNARFPMNNAFIMLFMGYEEDLGPFYALYDSHGRNLRDTIAYVIGLKKSKLPPLEYLKSGVTQPGPR
jgi:predicted aminopeptidase